MTKSGEKRKRREMRWRKLKKKKRRGRIKEVRRQKRALQAGKCGKLSGVLGSEVWVPRRKECHSLRRKVVGGTRVCGGKDDRVGNVGAGGVMASWRIRLEKDDRGCKSD